jgi:hypothetical protein
MKILDWEFWIEREFSGEWVWGEVAIQLDEDETQRFLDMALTEGIPLPYGTILDATTLGEVEIEDLQRTGILGLWMNAQVVGDRQIDELKEEVKQKLLDQIGFLKIALTHGL